MINKKASAITALIITLFLFIIIISSLKNTDLTSFTTKQTVTSIAVNPKQTYPGGKIIITIKPGTRSVRNELKFYKYNNIRVATTHSVCKNRSPNVRCPKHEVNQVIYTIPPNWKGQYYVQIQDIATRRPVKAYFTVTKQKKPTVTQLWIR